MTTQPWDQQPNETNTEYEEFTNWLNNSQYHNGHKKRDLKNTPSTINYQKRKQLSTIHNWNARAQAYDQHQNNQHHQQTLQHRQKIYDQHHETTKQLHQKTRQIIDSINPDDLTPKEKIALINTYNTYIQTTTNYSPPTEATTTTTLSLTEIKGQDPANIIQKIHHEITQRNNTP